MGFELSEGDLLALFAQYGEIVDVNLVRDKGTGNSKGFAFVAYEDQRSTILAVGNLDEAKVLGRIIKVDHCGEYVKREDVEEETKQKKRERERLVVYAELFRERSVLVEILANFLMMKKQLRTPVGVTKMVEVSGEIE